MPRSREVTRGRILDGAYGLFWRRGFARSGMDEIAAAAGVTKRTLYQHFESKDALLAAVLEAQGELALATFRRFGGGLTGDGPAIVDKLFSGLAQWYGRERWTGAGFTRLVFELADLPGHPARSFARRHKAAIEAELAKVFAAAGVDAAKARARQVYTLMEGALVMLLIHGDKSYLDAGADAAKALLGEAT